jgi:hypothetical protein
MRIVFLIGISLLCACGGWDSSKNLSALGDEELEALCGHFYDLAGGEPHEETCQLDGAEFKAVLGDRSTEIADCKAKERPACQTQLLEDCVMSLNGSLCGDMNSAACKTYVDCELGT